MSKGDRGPISVLGVCVDEPDPASPTDGPGLDVCLVGSGRRAVEMLRLLSFDLILVGLRLPDVGVWDFVRRVRTGWSWQKWILVAGPLGPLTDEQETSARMLGAMAVYDDVPTGDQLAAIGSRLRAKAASAVFAQSFGRATGTHDDGESTGYSSVAAF